MLLAQLQYGALLFCTRRIGDDRDVHFPRELGKIRAQRIEVSQVIRHKVERHTDCELDIRRHDRGCSATGKAEGYGYFHSGTAHQLIWSFCALTMARHDSKSAAMN